MLDGSHYFECRCDSIEHTLRFVVDNDPDDPCIYVEVNLNDWRGFWKRLWVGIKYIFGYKCKYGHWDITELKNEDIIKLKDICNTFINQHLKQP